jgi:hypothetical protein
LSSANLVGLWNFKKMTTPATAANATAPMTIIATENPTDPFLMAESPLLEFEFDALESVEAVSSDASLTVATTQLTTKATSGGST